MSGSRQSPAGAQDLPGSPKLQTAFGTTDPVAIGQVYGNIADGTARLLQQPNTTHPGNHILPEAIGDAIAWFDQTLEGANPLPASDQVWMWKEIGTLIALVDFVVLLAGAFDMLLKTQAFAHLRKQPADTAYAKRTGKWWLHFALATLIPVLTYYPFFYWATLVFPASAILPQSFTSQIALWAVLNGIIVLALGLVFKGDKVEGRGDLWGSVLIALATVGVGYIAVVATDSCSRWISASGSWR